MNGTVCAVGSSASAPADDRRNNHYHRNRRLWLNAADARPVRGRVADPRPPAAADQHRYKQEHEGIPRFSARAVIGRRNPEQNLYRNHEEPGTGRESCPHLASRRRSQENEWTLDPIPSRSASQCRRPRQGIHRSRVTDFKVRQDHYGRSVFPSGEGGAGQPFAENAFRDLCFRSQVYGIGAAAGRSSGEYDDAAVCRSDGKSSSGGDSSVAD